MKYCPYCGASVLDDTVSFCSECGKKLSISAKQPEEREQPKPAKKKDSEGSRHLKKKKPKISTPKPPKSAEEIKAEDGYDGYYDDIVPTDTGKTREGIDWVLMKKVGLVGAAVVVIIGLCVAAMYLL